jgi:hypothetical protein
VAVPARYEANAVALCNKQQGSRQERGCVLSAGGMYPSKEYAPCSTSNRRVCSSGCCRPAAPQLLTHLQHFTAIQRVLEHFVEQVADVQGAVRVRGSVVQHPRRACVVLRLWGSHRLGFEGWAGTVPHGSCRSHRQVCTPPTVHPSHGVRRIKGPAAQHPPAICTARRCSAPAARAPARQRPPAWGTRCCTVPAHTVLSVLTPGSPEEGATSARTGAGCTCANTHRSPWSTRGALQAARMRPADPAGRAYQHRVLSTLPPGAPSGLRPAAARWESYAALWYCSWGYTARLGGPLHARRCTPSHCGACVEGRHGSSCTVEGESSYKSRIGRLGMEVRSACFAAAVTLRHQRRSRTAREVRLRSAFSPSSVM